MKKTGENLCDLGLEKISWMKHKSRNQIEKSDKLNIIQIKNFCSSKDIKKKKKTNYRSGENICKICLINDLYPEYIKNNSCNLVIRTQQPSF